MLAIDVIESKPVNMVNGQNILDLTVSAFGGGGALKFVNVVQAPENFEMRPDLMSKLYLGDQDSMGMLLKLNAISNPFSVEQGDIFLIPNAGSVASLLAPASTSINNSSSNSSNSSAGTRATFRQQLVSRISKVSTARQNYLDARNSSSNSAQVLPPNVTQNETAPFQVQNGKIVLGANIGTVRTSITTNAALSSTKATLAQKKTNGV